MVTRCGFLSFILFISISSISLVSAGVAQRDDVLVIVNDNAPDSAVVANYYVQKRNINPANIVHVRTQPGYFISWNEFRVLRDQIIRFMQTNTLTDPAATPVTCVDGDLPYYCNASISQLRNLSKIRYIVTTKGVPTRTYVDNSKLFSAGAPTSVDNYLRHWLINYYSSDVTFNSNARAKAFGDGRGMRTVNPATDGELIIGRIDGITVEKAKALVDRALVAEAQGIYGKLYGSQFGSIGGKAVWHDYSAQGYPPKYVYGTSSTGWQYEHGIFGELGSPNPAAVGVRFDTNVACLNHIKNPANTPAGRSPQDCVVKLTRGSDTPPGRSNSRQPLVDNALVYLGSLDGQPTNGSFGGFMNWRRDTSCSVTLCDNAADPTACRAASTDPFKEINTQCVGVADGFIGYNFQSFPVSDLTIWPTGWDNVSTEGRIAFPVVRNTMGYDDNFSLWFENSDQIIDPLCFVNSADISTTSPAISCRDQRQLRIGQQFNFATRTYDATNPQRYHMGLYYKGENITKAARLQLRFYVREVTSRRWKAYPAIAATTALPLGNSGWVNLQADFVVDPAKHDPTWDLQYNQVRLVIETNTTFEGSVGIDAVTIQDLKTNTDIAKNGSFTQGHKQVAAGDHAANFLGRLNGTAFWGSLSHHQSGGHSFDQHPLETLIYFSRGLPLGDAVWFAENYNSGILYGDPLYSPLAVRLNYATNPYDFVTGNLKLTGDTVNGNDATKVDTNFSVDVCPNKDFFVCDQTGIWQSTNLVGVGGSRNTNLGSWDTSTVATGSYTIRLAVTSTRVADGVSQTFYDYYPVVVTDKNSDFDKDGLDDVTELTIGTDPTKADTDGDGLNDGAEVKLGTDPLNTDTDGDGLPDGWEASYPGLNPLVNDATADVDNDGLSNIAEFKAGTNPILVDTDGDGLNDGDEINTYKTNPTRADTDFDKINDGEEVKAGTDPNSNIDSDRDGMPDDWETVRGTVKWLDDARKDPDADGVDNIIEFLRNTLPTDVNSAPVIQTLYVDPVNGVDTNDGSKATPFASLAKATISARNGDTIMLASGNYALGFYAFSKSIQITGPADRSAIMNTSGVIINGLKWGGLSGVTWNVGSFFNYFRGRNIIFNHSQLNLLKPLSLPTGAKLTLNHVLLTNAGSSAAAITTPANAVSNQITLAVHNSTITGFPLGIKWNSGYDLRVTNTIIDTTISVENGYGFQLRYSLIKDGQFTRYNGNLTGVPGFVDALTGNYHLQPNSAAVDSGNPFEIMTHEPASPGNRLDIGFYGNTPEASVALDADGDGLPDGWETAVGLNPAVADRLADSDNDGVNNGIEFKMGTDPMLSNSHRGLIFYALNPNQINSSLDVVALSDSTWLYGSSVVQLNAFERASIPTTSKTREFRIIANKAVSIGNGANGVDMPAPDWMSGRLFVVPHFRFSHQYYVYSPYGEAKLTITHGSNSRQQTIPANKVVTIDGGTDNTLSTILRSDRSILVSHSSSFNNSLVDTYTVPPAAKEIVGVQSRFIVVGAAENNTQVSLNYSDGTQTSLTLNAGERRVISTSASPSRQGLGRAVRITADKPIAAIQAADGDGIEATAFWDPLYSARRYGLPVAAQYAVAVCTEATTITRYAAGVAAQTVNCTPSATGPGKVYFGSEANGSTLAAGEYFIANLPIYMMYESTQSNDEENLFGAL